MKYCPNCGTGLDDAAAFCVSCGTPQGQPVQPPVEPAAVEQPIEAPAPEVVPTTAYVGEPQSPAYAPAPNYAPNYAPVYPANYAPAPTVPTGSKVLGFVGFGLSMLASILSLAAISAAAEEAEAGFALALFFVVTGVLGMIFCGNAIKAGFKNGLTVTGKICGLISTIMFGLASFISIIEMM